MPLTTLEAAAAIGRRIVSTATWSGDTCSWKVRRYNGIVNGALTAVEQWADPSIYQGVAGTGLFLTELSAATGEIAFARAARGALRHAANQLQRAAPARSHGFYAGRSGVAYAHAQAFRVTNEGSFAEIAQRLAFEAATIGSREGPCDLTSGVAGTLLGTLLVAEQLSDSALVIAAVRLGEILIERAQCEAIGWSWSPNIPGMRNLTGLSHGASGVAAALGELWSATGDARFAVASLQAFAYEADHFDRASGNWPDYRDTELADALGLGHASDLAQYLSKRRERRTPNVGVKSWCHGAPGIALARQRGAALFPESDCAHWAAAALETTIEMLHGEPYNYSLCHGAFGNLEPVHNALGAAPDSRWASRIDQIVAEAIERFERGTELWPCGTADLRPDASLMLGEAGIGYALLRFSRPAVPSILLPRLTNARKLACHDTLDLRDRAARHFFGAALAELELPDGEGDRMLRDAIASTPIGQESRRLGELLRARLNLEKDEEIRRRMRATLRAPRLAYAVSRSSRDLTLPFVVQTTAPATNDVNWLSARMRLRSWVRVVPSGCGVLGGMIIDGSHAEVSARAVGPFAFAVLRALRRWTTFDAAIRSISTNFRADEADLRQLALAQIVAAHRRGFVELAQVDPRIDAPRGLELS